MKKEKETTRLDQTIHALRLCYDPEIPVNIYDLGLIYDIDVDAPNRISIRMTLTSPLCPVAEILPSQVKKAVTTITGVNGVAVTLVWDSPWSMDRMSEEARLELGWL
mgnify:FL=1